MYCKHCGKDVGDAAWCPYCGAKQEADNQSQQTNSTTESQNAWGEQVNLSTPEPRTNGFAIAGFVLAFLSPILGLIFSIIGFTKVAVFGSGKGFAVAGIIISIANFIFSLIFYFLYMPMLMAFLTEIFSNFGIS